MASKIYLGDGVYAETESGMIKLTAGNGLEEAENIVYLLPEVMGALARFAERAFGDVR